MELHKVSIPNRPIGPFPTVLVGADVNGRPNFSAVGAYGVVSLEPVLYVSLHVRHYTTRGVQETGFFSVNIPSADLVQRVDYCGLVSGAKVDKSHVFTVFYDERGRAPLIRECPANFVCRVVQTVPQPNFMLFIGEIVAAVANETCLTDGKPDPAKIDPLILMGTHYWSLGQIHGTVYQTGKGYSPKPDEGRSSPAGGNLGNG